MVRAQLGTLNAQDPLQRLWYRFEMPGLCSSMPPMQRMADVRDLLKDKGPLVRGLGETLVADSENGMGSVAPCKMSRVCLHGLLKRNEPSKLRSG